MQPVSAFQPASRLPRDMNAASTSNNGEGSSAAGPAAPNRGVVQPKPRPLIRGAQGTGSTVLVNSCQRGNPVLQHIRNVGWEYGDIVPDYQTGVASCVLFLSLRYHRLHPEYIHTRIQKLQQMYTLRILLVMCDVNDHQTAIRELTKVALINNLTMMVAWTAEEAGRYIETYKSFEHKPPDMIKERVSEDYMSQLTSVLTSVRGINKTDVVTLISTFGSLERISRASAGDLAMCPGFGEIKAKRLREVFHQPFRVGETRSRLDRRRGIEGSGDDAANNSSETPARQNGASGSGAAAAASMRPIELADDILAPGPESAPAAPEDGHGEARATGAEGNTSTSTVDDATASGPEASASRAVTAAPAPARAIEAVKEEFDDMTEEEQMRLAMELSMAEPDHDTV